MSKPEKPEKPEKPMTALERVRERIRINGPDPIVTAALEYSNRFNAVEAKWDPKNKKKGQEG